LRRYLADLCPTCPTSLLFNGTAATHLFPTPEKQRKQDRPDLIKSELAGLAFDSLQQIFRKCDIAEMFSATPLALVQDQTVWLIIDPAAGGPGSDYAIVSIVRQRGTVTVSPPQSRHRSGDAVPVAARLHELRHRLLRAEEAHHQLLPQVQQEARDALLVPRVHQQHARLQTVVDFSSR